MKFEASHSYSLDSWEGITPETNFSGTPLDFVTVVLALTGESEEKIRLARDGLFDLMTSRESQLDLSPLQGNYIGMICNRERTFQYPIVSSDGQTWEFFDSVVYSGSIRSLINQAFNDVSNRLVGLRALEAQKDIRFWSLYMIDGSKFVERSIYCTDRNTLNWHRSRLSNHLWKATDVSRVLRLPSIPGHPSEPFEEEMEVQLDQEARRDRKRPRDDVFFIDKVGNKKQRVEKKE